MLIPLGILAASGASAGSYELIETITVGSGGAASVTFSNLNTYSSDYQHLQIRMVSKSANSGVAYTFMRMNGVSSASYSRHVMFPSGGSVASQAITSASEIVFQTLPGTSDANSFSAGVIDILDAYETNKNKTIRFFIGTSTQSDIGIGSGVLYSTNAISSILLQPLSGSFGQYSRFSIYGLKAN